MNIEDIELRAQLQHKGDELNGLLGDAPDCLRKRLCMFMSVELLALSDRAREAKESKDEEAMAKVSVELQVMAMMNQIQDLLPTD